MSDSPLPIPLHGKRLHQPRQRHPLRLPAVQDRLDYIWGENGLRQPSRRRFVPVPPLGSTIIWRCERSVIPSGVTTARIRIRD